ncbi:MULTISPECIES: aa3-type cytochrome oxidase subunit II [Microbacterium]|uniref:cytochrome-c oxidase n=1 Tax=Microbacterium aquilitoris TaxID=3067307 RepID=A0ABU3GPW2_9MICO|nr:MULTISPECIES: cytochrome c oxidase subunit II [unclassified Microbacterium]MDT3331604.1 cytochrome c oxidase subunit II [Microbacterium sp. KSW-18]MDT3343625.1 cytochrome c oxidase subunit II [Microbacterium sp. KSW2-22]SDG99599.1 cytochrome c oxidase subunit 2 [Microbacterium sp. 77mftsu3.1]
MRVNRRLRWVALPLTIASAVALAGCSPTTANGFLPGFDEGGGQATNHTSMIAGLWTTSWIVVLAVGVITWALMGWAAIAYRRRKGQSGLPVQLRYNMPIEMFFTIAPVILVLGFFAFTARDQAILETQYEKPDVCITAIGKQWAWDFQYNGDNCDDPQDPVWTIGVQAQTDAQGNITNEVPELVLPVNKEVTLQLESRDVIHSFWIVDFLYKKDMYPGRENYWSFTPTKEGTFVGKCAELCGQYHSMMLFNVKVVSDSEYQSYIASLKAKGQTGDIDDALDRQQNAPGTGAPAAEGEHNN